VRPAGDGVVHVPAGRVDEISAALLAEHSFDPDVLLVAHGGGRVIDTAKAIAGAIGGRCAAIPTTLSGAEMTPFHRTPAGVEGARLVRPALVLADPDVMAGAPMPGLAASAMNALAHAMEALYTPFANPVATMAALRAATLLASGISADPPDREELALGAILAGYASGSTGIAVHHAVCQTLVREAGTPHAETNAVMLPHSAALMTPRAPEALADFSAALGAHDLDSLAARSGHTRLSTLGVRDDQLPAVAATVTDHPLLGNTPQPPDEAELLELLRAAL
jgi:alcohol dehydrogenase class IV